MTAGDGLRGAERWFSSVNMAPPLPRGAEATVRELVAMLDALSPSLVDRTSAGVSVDVSGDGAVVAWLGTHEHVDSNNGSPDRHWTSIVADVVAAALSGEYAVESIHRSGRVVRTRVLDDVRDRLVISETGSLLAWLPFGRRSTQLRRLD